MFSFFVRRDGLIDPPELGDTDNHCHILPGIDDGPRDMEGSVALARRLVEMGVSTAVATPHVISDLYPNTRETILETRVQVQQQLDERNIPLTVIPGAEYYCEPAFLYKVDQEPLLSFGEKNYVLFESPTESKPALLNDLVFALLSNGYTPLLAHVERYRFIQDDFSVATELKRRGVAFQVNHPSFGLARGNHRGDLARLLYKKGLVDELGSDMHKVPPSREMVRPSQSGLKRILGNRLSLIPK